MLTTPYHAVATNVPADAIVLFDGGENPLFVSMSGKAIDWPIKDGVLVSSPGNTRSNHLVSKLHFRNARIHVEFMLPRESSGNSGIYVHGHYELQIINSAGKEKQLLTEGDMGSVYGFSPPLLNAARGPELWQTYDIEYHAPIRDSQGTITELGKLSAQLNGQQVQKELRFGEPRSVYHPFRYGTTKYLKPIAKRQKETMTGPLFLQDHDSPVRFRNIWVQPLDDQAYLYQPPLANPSDD